MPDNHELESAVTTQVLLEEDQQLLDTAYGRLKIWLDGCRHIHDRAREARSIMLLDDPRQDEGRDRSQKKTIQVQTLHSTITNCIADQMDNMPEARMLPERPDLQSVAEDMTDVVQYVLRANDYENKHRQMAEDLFVTGTVVTQVVWDEDMDDGKGNIAVLRWPVESFLWDPKASDMQEGRAVMKVSWHPISWYREHYPEEGIYVGAEDRQYGDVGRPDKWENDMGDEPMAMLVEYWWREYSAKTRRYTVNVAYFAGGALLEKHLNVYKHGMYPFDMACYDHIEGSPAGEGLVMELAPMMRYVNRYARYIDENASMSAKIRMLVKRNAGLDTKALADWNENLIAGDTIDDMSVRWLQSRPLNNTVMNQMLQFQTDIKQDSGQNQFTRGETAGGVTAASAISALQEAGGKITRLHTQELNQSFARIAHMIAWLVSQFYTGNRTRMVTGRDGSQREINMSASHLMGRKNGQKDSLPAPPYTVQIQVQRRNPLRVQAQNELILQAYQMSVQNGIPFKLTDLFALLNVDGKDRIIPQLAANEQQSDQMAQLAQQVEQMQAENDALRKTVQSYSQSMQAAASSNIDDMSQSLPIETGTTPVAMG